MSRYSREMNEPSGCADNNEDIETITVSGDGECEINHQEETTNLNKFQASRAVFREFLLNSSIGGLSYLAAERRHWMERVWWILVIIVSLFLCGCLIQRANENRIENPSILSYTDALVSISDIPFPQVTICSQLKSRSITSDIQKRRQKTNDENTPFQLESVFNLCDQQLNKNQSLQENYTEDYNLNIIRNAKPFFNIQGLKTSRTADGSYVQTIVQFNDSFVTEEGVCYSFNALNSRDIFTEQMASEMMTIEHYPNVEYWSLENGYFDKFQGELPYPGRVSDAVDIAGLQLTLIVPEFHSNDVCRAPVQGFKVMLNTPGDVPRPSKQYLWVPFNEDVRVYVKPQMITTSPSLRYNQPSRRQCFFNSERQLRFFKSYTQQNCELECLANFTKSECGCVKFSMPRDKTTPICDASKIKCCYNVENSVVETNAAEAIRKSGFKQKGCNCLPACTSITFDTKVSRNKIDLYNITMENLRAEYDSEIPEDIIKKKIKTGRSKLNIFYESLQFVAMKRSEYINKIDFVANCGGLFGLFLGASALSIVEVVYYFTIRLTCSLRHREHRILQRTNKVAPFENTNKNVQKNSHYGSIHQTVFAVFREFSSKSTIHGVRYFDNQQFKHWSERVWWILSFGLSLILSGLLIRQTWLKWEQSPTVLSHANEFTSVRDIPFPVVTICPDIKFRRETLKFPQILRMLRSRSEANISQEMLTRMRAVFQFCSSELNEIINLEEEYADESIYTTLEEIALTLNETIDSCKWHNKNQNCSSLLQPILTEHGLCFTFNDLSPGDIYTENMAPDLLMVNENQITPHVKENIHNRKSYPYRGSGEGITTGLSVSLTLFERDFDFLCNYFQRFKIFFHTHGEVILNSAQLYLPLMHDIWISIKPQMITTSEGLRNQSPIKRKCFMDSERQLYFFKVYTQRNCALECIANLTERFCNCAHFWMPRKRNTYICGTNKFKCVQLVRSGYTMLKMAANCNCLPACSSITYDVDISQVEFNRTSFLRNSTSSDEILVIQSSRLSIYFKESEFLGVVRSELYSQIDFLASCGSVLGLFMGISLISLIEIVYYFTLRLTCLIRDDQWHIQKLKGLVHSTQTNDASNRIVKSAKERRIYIIKRHMSSDLHARPITS